MSRVWLESAKKIDGLELVALVDIHEDSAQKRKAEFGFDAAITDTDLETVLSKLKPDLVFDCTVPEAHTPTTLGALRHGCHVLGEKPMADSLDNARRCIEEAQKANRLYAVIQNRRYLKSARRVRHFLQSEMLGALTTVHVDFFIGAHFGGFRDHMRHVLLIEMAIHTFDSIRFFSNADPISVYCREWNPRGSWYDHDASAVAIFEMTNGVSATYRGSWCGEGVHTTWESDWRFIGTHGSATWDGGEHFLARVVDAPNGLIWKQRDVSLPEVDATGKEDGHLSIMQEFVNCVREGGTPETNCEDNIKSLAMVYACIESAERGQKVNMT